MAALFILLPIVDTLSQAWPLHPTSPSWRYGTVGLGANYLISFVFGMALLSLIAALGEHRRTLRVMAVFGGVVTLVLLLAAGGFALDALEVRPSVPRDNPGNLWVFDVGAGKAAFKYVASAIVMGVLAFACRHAWRACPAPTPKAPPPLVGRRTTPA